MGKNINKSTEKVENTTFNLKKSKKSTLTYICIQTNENNTRIKIVIVK